MELVKNYSQSDCVENIKGTVTEDGELTLSWDWPQNESYNLCFVFELLEEDENLESLLKRDAEKMIYGNGIGICHKAMLGEKPVRFRVYPAREEGGQCYIVDQSEGNISERFCKKKDLVYWVEYNVGKFFSKVRKASICFDGLENLEETYICYSCESAGLGQIFYGIDLDKFGGQSVFEVTVGKKDVIKVYLSEEQKNRINLIER